MRVRIPLLSPNIIRTKMERQSEKRTEQAVKTLLHTLEQNLTDTGKILDEYEAEHSEWESDQSAHYRALVAGHFALESAINEINYQLNKK